MSNFKKIRPVIAQLFHEDGRTDGQNTTKLILAFRSFANAPKMKSKYRLYNFLVHTSVVISKYCSFSHHNFVTGREDADHMSVWRTARDRNERP